MTEYPDGWLTNLSKYIGGLNEELEKAKAENAELLRELDLTKRMYAKVSEEKCVTDAENARLRELVRTLVYCYGDDVPGNTVGCDGCAMNGADMHVTIDGTFACDGLQHELKSLGIEVSE